MTWPIQLDVSLRIGRRDSYFLRFFTVLNVLEPSLHLFVPSFRGLMLIHWLIRRQEERKILKGSCIDAVDVRMSLKFTVAVNVYERPVETANLIANMRSLLLSQREHRDVHAMFNSASECRETCKVIFVSKFPRFFLECDKSATSRDAKGKRDISPSGWVVGSGMKSKTRNKRQKTM